MCVFVSMSVSLYASVCLCVSLCLCVFLPVCLSPILTHGRVSGSLTQQAEPAAIPQPQSRLLLPEDHPNSYSFYSPTRCSLITSTCVEPHHELVQVIKSMEMGVRGVIYLVACFSAQGPEFDLLHCINQVRWYMLITQALSK